MTFGEILRKNRKTYLFIKKWKKYLKLIKTNVKKIKINIYDLELQKKNNFRKFKQKILKKVKK